MKRNGDRGMVPKLRFPEFWSEPGWADTTLGEIADFYKGRGISKAEIDPEGKLQCIRYGELYTHYGEIIDYVHSRTNAELSELLLSRKNDVIIPASGETKLDIAKASCVLRDGVALGSDLNVIRTVHEGRFLSYYLNGAKRRDIAKVAQGDAVVHLYASQLANLALVLPGAVEQKKIADCLSSLDEVISAQARTVKALQAYKKGLMQQLFPREGEIYPGLQFREFQCIDGWRRRKISSLVSKVSRPVAVEAQRMYREIGIRSHGKGIFHKDPISGEAIGDKRVFSVAKNALVINIVFAWEQAVATTSDSEEGMIASHRFPMYVAKAGMCDVGYLKYFFLTRQGKHLLGLASPGGAGRNRTLGQEQFEKLEILLPEDVEEQSRIADFLSSIGGLIDVQLRKLTVLRTHKEGLMRQLFPSTEEVAA